MTQRAQLVKIGKLGRPHGLKGELRLFTDNLDSDTPRPGLMLHIGREEFEIETCRPSNQFWIVGLVGIGDRNQASLLTNQTIKVDRDDLPKPDDDEFYQIDLVGLEVQDTNGLRLGEIDGFLDDVDTDVMVVKRKNEKNLLVPMIARIVHQFQPEEPVIIAPLSEWASEDE